MTPLYRLPNGEWVDLLLVTAIVPQPARGGYPDRVSVVCDRVHYTFAFESISAAEKWSDDLARGVNLVRGDNSESKAK